MITCSVYRGMSYNPISNFDCLLNDVPYLPVNKADKVIKDMNVDVKTTSSTIEFNKNTIIHKITLQNLTDDIDTIKIQPMIEINNNIKELDFNYKNIFNEDISLNKSNILLIDIDIENMIKYIEKNKNIKNYTICFKFIFSKNNNVINENIIKFNLLEAIFKSSVLNLSNTKLSNLEINNIPNGSISLCMDTGDVYKFDEEYDKWLKL